MFVSPYSADKLAPPSHEFLEKKTDARYSEPVRISSAPNEYTPSHKLSSHVDKGEGEGAWRGSNI